MTDLSDAIGKCHEAWTYIMLHERFPTAEHEDIDHANDLIDQYLPVIQRQSEIDERLHEASIETCNAIDEYLVSRLGNPMQVERLSLKSQAYLEDRLDTTDLEVQVRGKSFSFSLKALKRASTPNLKNPGVGQLFGPDSYFGGTAITSNLAQLKVDFEAGELDNDPPYRPASMTTNRHANALLRANNLIYEGLNQLDQEELVQGIQNLLGSSICVIAGYDPVEVHVKETPSVTAPISVEREPNSINTTMLWDTYRLVLRVKFSHGTTSEYGWSSLKLAVKLEEK